MKYSGQMLAMVARLLIDRKKALDSSALSYTREIQSICDGAEIDRPSNQKINQAMSKPVKKPDPKVRLALEGTVEVLLRELDVGNGELVEIEGEAQRRVLEEDFTGTDRDLVAGRRADRDQASPGVGSSSGHAGQEDTLSGYAHVQKTIESVANQIGTRKRPDSQRPVRSIAGDYLIVRYLFSQDRFVTSHMRIFAPRAERVGDVKQYNRPAWFKTTGGEEYETRDFSLVRGVIFSSDKRADSFMSIGEIENQIDLRASILTKVPKPGPVVSGAEATCRDLYGLRLSFGSALVGQVAHRIWCSYLPKNQWGLSLQTTASTYTSDDFDKVYSNRLDGFTKIKQWITAFPSMTMMPYTVERNRITVPRHPFDEWMNGSVEAE